MKYVLIFTVLVCSYLVLNDLHKTEQRVLYKQCLKEYNYSELENRYRKASSRWTKNRLEHRAIELKTKCNNKAKEHFSL